MKISKNITLQEATFSPTAFRLGIENVPNEEQLANMKLVAEKCFQPLREWYKKPIRINSFFRCKELNEAVKGSKTSDHMEGKAIDISAGNKHENKRLFDWCKANLDYDQLIWEYGDALGPQWVHISYNKEKNRKQILIVK